jgi:hypothetical protein
MKQRLVSFLVLSGMWACAHESPVAVRPGLSLTNASWIAAMVSQYPEARHRREALVNWLLQHTYQPGELRVESVRGGGP